MEGAMMVLIFLLVVCISCLVYIAIKTKLSRPFAYTAIFVMIALAVYLLFVVPFKEKTSDINIKKTEFYLDKSVAIYIENRDTVRQNFYSLSEYNLLKDSTTKYQLITYLSIFNKELFYHIEIKNPVFYNRKLFKNHIINKKEI